MSGTGDKAAPRGDESAALEAAGAEDEATDELAARRRARLA